MFSAALSMTSYQTTKAACGEQVSFRKNFKQKPEPILRQANLYVKSVTFFIRTY